jgi:phage terminase large subunit-like protein
VWEAANPNWGVTIREDFLREECQRAIETPAFENTFKRLYWDACAEPVDPQSLRGKPCVAGLDLATVKDMAALVLLFGDDESGFDVLPFFWCPREEAERRDRKDRIPYLTWARQGFLELTDGNSIDYRRIRQRTNELAEQYIIREIGADPYNASHLITELEEEDGLNIVQVRQGMLSMSPPTKQLLRLLLDKKIRHGRALAHSAGGPPVSWRGGHPILRWNAANAAGKTDHAENLMPDKEKSGEKIDGVVAMIIALSRAIVGKGGSVYDERDPRWV